VKKPTHETLADNLCSNCKTPGLCCTASAMGLKGEKIYLPSLPCRYLDMNTKQCKVYFERFEKAPWCQDMFWFKTNKDTLPPECEYHNEIKFSKVSRVASKEEELPILTRVFENHIEGVSLKPFTEDYIIKQIEEKKLAPKKIASRLIKKNRKKMVSC